MNPDSLNYKNNFANSVSKSVHFQKRNIILNTLADFISYLFISYLNKISFLPSCIVFFVTTVICFFSPTIHAWDEFKGYAPSIWDFEIDAQYFKATSNFSRSGNEFQRIDSKYSYQLVDSNFGVRYTPSYKMGFYGGTRYAYAESKDPWTTRTNGSFTHGFIGMDALLIETPSFELVPDFNIWFPLQRVDANKDQVLNSEGALEISGRVIARLIWKGFHPYGFIGYTYLDEGRSSQMPYGGGAEFDFKSFAIGAGVAGFQRITYDKYSDTPSVKESVAVYNGSALKYYSVNASRLDANAWLKWDEGKSFAWTVGGGASIAGESTAAGWQVFTNLNFRLATGRTPTKKSIDPKVEKFKEENTDSIDQSLFDPPKVEVIRPPTVSPKESDSLKKRQLQKELDDTEMQIELKSIRRKK